VSENYSGLRVTLQRKRVSLECLVCPFRVYWRNTADYAKRNSLSTLTETVHAKLTINNKDSQFQVIIH